MGVPLQILLMLRAANTVLGRLPPRTPWWHQGFQQQNIVQISWGVCSDSRERKNTHIIPIITLHADRYCLEFYILLQGSKQLPGHRLQNIKHVSLLVF